MTAGGEGERVYGGIEAGGTKFVCVAGVGPDDIRLTRRIAVTRPGVDDRGLPGRVP